MSWQNGYGAGAGDTTAPNINISVTHAGTLLPFEGVTGDDRIMVNLVQPPPTSPPPAPPPMNQLLARAVVGPSVGNAGAWAASWAEVMSGKGQSENWASNASEWGWAGLSPARSRGGGSGKVHFSR